jgi:type I restriction enzyme S subunit
MSRSKKDSARENEPRFEAKKAQRAKAKEARGRVPRLRFPDFRGKAEWEVKEIGEVFNVTRGEVLSMTVVKGVFTREAPYPVYSSQTKENGLAGYYSDYLYENAITWTTDGANAGEVNYRPGKFYCTNVCGVLINTAGYANASVASIINSVSKKHVSYVGNPKLMNGVMSKIKIPFPSIPEQQKIAACLTSLDELIAAHSHKLEALKKYKKGLMQRLFPAEGETVPRLRFPEFRDVAEWAEATLKKIAEIENGKAHENNIVDDGRYILVNSKFISSNGETKKYTNDAFCLAKREDVLLVMSDVPNGKAIAKCFFVEKENMYTVNQRICRLTTKKATGKMLYYTLDRNPYYLAFDDGVKQTNLRNEDVLGCPVFLPSFSEQHKITSLLSSLDELISAQAVKIEELKEHKRGLMQGLFPAAEEAE